MIIVRIGRGIKEHFPARASEWGFAALLAGLGWLFLKNPDLFDASLAYGNLARLADEKFWGIACITIGLARLLALIINGTFADSRYGRWSPHVRGTCAFLSCGVWFPLAGGFLAQDRTLIVTLYAVTVLVIDAYNIRRVWHDAGRATLRADEV